MHPFVYILPRYMQIVEFRVTPISANEYRPARSVPTLFPILLLAPIDILAVQRAPKILARNRPRVSEELEWCSGMMVCSGGIGDSEIGFELHPYGHSICY